MSPKPLILVAAVIAALIPAPAKAAHSRHDQNTTSVAPTARSPWMLDARLRHQALALTIPIEDCAHAWIGGPC